jgi:hypothetical protein
MPDRFKHMLTRMDRSEWFDPTEPIPWWHSDGTDEAANLRWRLVSARNRMVAAQSEWLATQPVLPLGANKYEWQRARGIKADE